MANSTYPQEFGADFKKSFNEGGTNDGGKLKFNCRNCSGSLNFGIN